MGLVDYMVGREHNLRQMAVQTVLQVAGRGNSTVLGTLLPLARHAHRPQRQSSLEALKVLAEPNDPEVVKALMQRMVDPHENCRQAACEALGLLVHPGDESVVAALVRQLELDSSWIVRYAIGDALVQIA